MTKAILVRRAKKEIKVTSDLKANRVSKAFRAKRATLDRKVSRALKVTKAMLVLGAKKEIKVIPDLKAKGAKQVCKVNKEYRVFKVKKAM